MMKFFIGKRWTFQIHSQLITTAPRIWNGNLYLESASVLKHAEQMFHFTSFPNLLYMISLSVWEEHCFGE